MLLLAAVAMLATLPGRSVGIGSRLLAYVFESTGSYNPAFCVLTPADLALALAGWFVKRPQAPAPP